MSDDDFYGNDNDTTNHQYLSNKESDRQAQKIFPIGYQDGLEIGQEITLQRGFNEGFVQGSTIAYRWSQLLGLISSLDVFFHHNKQYIPDNVDSRILESLVEKINSIIKDKCAPPSIGDLKSFFMSFKDDDSDLETTTTTSKTNSNSNSSCCKKDGSDTETNSCGGNSETDCCKSNLIDNDIIDSDDNDDINDKCCGGNDGQDSGCCKSNTTNSLSSLSLNDNQSTITTTTTSTTKSKETKRITMDQIQDELFQQVCRECVETIIKMGLDGKQLLKDCLKNTYRVSMN